MASELRVNFNTIARAYRALDEAGIISTQHGRGTYILAQTSDEVTEKIRREALEGLTRRYLADAAQLGGSPEEMEQILKHYFQTWLSEGKAPDLNRYEK
jgi:GntR family transcriptional regulator